jgi:transposase
MERIHFAQYVINDIRENGAKIADMFMAGYMYINTDRKMDRHDRYCTGNERDDWHLSVDTHWLAFGLYREVHLVRGERDSIKMPDRATKKALVAEFDRLERERKARNKAAALAEKERKERAQWWP